MWAGKSEKLIQIADRWDYKEQPTLLIRYKLDNRYSETSIVSHKGITRKAETASTVEDIDRLIDSNKPKILLLDEAQFYKGIFNAVKRWTSAKIEVILSALDMDVFGNPWPEIANLLCESDTILKLTAVCLVCKKNATRTQLLIDPSKFTNGTNVLIGGKDLYEPRCKLHFSPAKQLT